jgi:hypothetical protein
VSGNTASLHDYGGNDAIAGMLNHPEKYPAIDRPANKKP